MQGMLIKSVDITKLGGIANTLKDRKKIQNELGTLELWTENKRMKFNKEKSKVLHLGKRNQSPSYKMGYPLLSNTISKEDLGITS